MIKTRTFVSVGSVALLLALAGCQAVGPGSQQMAARPMIQAPQMNAGGVEGEWASTDGVAISRFSNGRFETLATDTGNKLAEGNYTQVDPATVSISVTSLIRQTTTQVNCAMVTQTQLNCTSSAGQQFSLIRRASGMS